MYGGRTRARTWDPLIKSQLLCQLSYAPVDRLIAKGGGFVTSVLDQKFLVSRTGFRQGVWRAVMLEHHKGHTTMIGGTGQTILGTTNF